MLYPFTKGSDLKTCDMGFSNLPFSRMSSFCLVIDNPHDLKLLIVEHHFQHLVGHKKMRFVKIKNILKGQN
jgi:hypothetical protein